jgi:peptide/nickel transport system ATP-binding protein
MSEVVIEAKNVVKDFKISQGIFKNKEILRAVDGVSLKITRGEVLALVGESGCGKTTLAKILLGLLPPSSGSVDISGQPIDNISRIKLAKMIQPVFQDPYSSLNPRKTIGSIISLPMRVQGDNNPDTWQSRVHETMDLVGLQRRMFNQYPNQLSGGQRQRVAIARALINRPEVVICDEPTSALDVSVQSQILNLLNDLRRELNLTYIIISHNLAVVEHMATRVAVMYFGEMVEEAETDNLFSDPKHSYTQKLLNSILPPDPRVGLPEIPENAES